jgi:phage tail P2-like protein
VINLYDSNITDILPNSLLDTKVKSLGYAIKKANQQLLNYAKQVAFISALDLLPENILDLLAMEYRTQYYDEALARDIKIQLIKNTLIWYMKAGTPAAVEELIRIVFGSGEVEEWFQYNGEPGTFKIITSESVGEDSIQLFNKMIKNVKNTRSHLTSIESGFRLNQKVNVGAMQVMSVKIVIK